MGASSLWTLSGLGPANLLVLVLDDGRYSITVGDGKESCKKDGWRAYGVFKNQGDCVSYMATDGRNQPAGSTKNTSMPLESFTTG